MKMRWVRRPRPPILGVGPIRLGSCEEVGVCEDVAFVKSFFGRIWDGFGAWRTGQMSFLQG